MTTTPCLLLLMAGALIAPTDDGWRIVLRGGDTAFSVRPDGSDRKAVPEEPTAGTLSPDGKSLLRIVDEGIVVTGADRKNPRKISAGNSASWSPDSKRIVFTQEVNGLRQVFTAAADGAGVQRVSDAKLGAHSPKFLPDGRLLWLQRRESREKAQPSDLVVSDGKSLRILVENAFVSDFACSPDGKTLAYGRIGALVFHDLATDQSRSVAYQEISDKLYAHGAYTLRWRPDGKAVACRIEFLGGRTSGAVVFGDSEVFVIPLEGKPTWFLIDQAWKSLDWIPEKADAKR